MPGYGRGCENIDLSLGFWGYSLLNNKANALFGFRIKCLYWHGSTH